MGNGFLYNRPGHRHNRSCGRHSNERLPHHSTISTSRVRSLFVAYSTDYPKARELADRYDMPLVPVNRDKVLTAGEPSRLALEFGAPAKGGRGFVVAEEFDLDGVED